MVKRKISKAELERRVDGGAMVADRKPVEKPAPAPVEPPAPPVVVETAPAVNTGMAAMAASIAQMQADNNRISERVSAELVKLNNRTRARLTVTQRNEGGGIDAAEIEILPARKA